VPSPQPEKRLDGRRQRAVRTRAAIVSALYDLVRAGDPTPTAAQIAARAGVALRSIGQHFPSREALLGAVAVHHGGQLGAAREALRTTGGLRERLATLCRVRADELERTAPLRRAIAAMPGRSVAVAAAQRADRDRRRAELAAVFAIELTARPVERREALVDRLYLVSSGPTWDVLREHQGLTARAAAAELRALLAMVLRSAEDVEE
jgi:AcrR family transcriptional regulator